MGIRDIEIRSLEGGPAVLPEGLLLIVNVASKCGMTPQYEELEQVHRRYADQGFSVVGVPCNQFLGQEPGTAEEIREFCSLTYGVTFPMLEKTDVNGPQRHPLYAELTRCPDEAGTAGEVEWNFEKFLVAADDTLLRRFRSGISPEDERILSAIEANLPR